MPLVEKSGVFILPLAISLIISFFSSNPEIDNSSKFTVNIDSLEKVLDSTLIHQSIILGATALKKDSGVKVLTKVCRILKTENKVLKVENKNLKTNLEIASNKPADTIVILQKVGLFGKIKNDTL